jgi:hypothetical protein
MTGVNGYSLKSTLLGFHTIICFKEFVCNAKCVNTKINEFLRGKRGFYELADSCLCFGLFSIWRMGALFDVKRVMIMIEFLTKEELRNLTGYQVKKLQIKWLSEHNYRFTVNALGEPKVMREYIRQLLCGADQKKQPRKCGPDENALMELMSRAHG